MENGSGSSSVSRKHRTGASRPRPSRILAGAALSALATLVLAAPAAATEVLLPAEEVTATENQGDACFSRAFQDGASGVDSRSLTPPGPGQIEATLQGPSSADWDVALIDRTSGDVVGASASSGSTEVASGFLFGNEDLVVQACRRSGSGTANLSVGFAPLPTGAEPTRVSLVKVTTPTPGAKQKLQTFDVDPTAGYLTPDLTEHGGRNFITVVTYGQEQLAALRQGNFETEVLVPDMALQASADRQADERWASSPDGHGQTELPSGQRRYRHLYHYQEEMKRLADRFPGLVKQITLPLPTYEGRIVEGLEITTNSNRNDGKPVFLNMGLHHAREWPSGEHAIEWAYELLEGYKRGNDRTRNLVRETRTVIVPIVNPDGFDISRETGELMCAATNEPDPPIYDPDQCLTDRGRDADSYEEVLAQLVVYGTEYWRKNCRLPTSETPTPTGVGPKGDCELAIATGPSNGIFHSGVDPNRNYGGLWGGPGANASNPYAADYRGPGPFSEPETRNVKRLVGSRQVTMALSNHTFSNLWLRPPGVAGEPDTVDEPVYKRLGADMAEENGYSNIKSYQLYDTTGTYEDWGYYTAGGFGFTPEIGCEKKDGHDCEYGNFHGRFKRQVSREYWGETHFAEALNGGGNRQAYFDAMRAAAREDLHSVLRGSAPGGTILKIQKNFRTSTYPDEDREFFPDHLESDMRVPGSGRFTFHMNPSTRPIIAQESGREATGEPSDPVHFQGDPSGPPNDGAAPCAQYPTNEPTCVNYHPFRIPAGEGIDNARATVTIEWLTPAHDWDLQVVRDVNRNGAADDGEPVVAESAQGGTNFEEATLSEDQRGFEPGKKYVAKVINYAATEPYEGTVTFEGPEPPQGGEREPWILTCETRGGDVLHRERLFISRGQAKSRDLREECAG